MQCLGKVDIMNPWTNHGQATILKLPKTHWVPSGQQMVPQATRKQSEGLIQKKMRALSATEEDTNNVWNRRLSSFWDKVLCLHSSATCK